MNRIKDIYNENSYLQIEICDNRDYFSGLIEIQMDGYGVDHAIEEATYQLKYDYKIEIETEDINKIKKIYHDYFN
jgi:hypothetical protein